MKAKSAIYAAVIFKTSAPAFPYTFIRGNGTTSVENALQNLMDVTMEMLEELPEGYLGDPESMKTVETARGEYNANRFFDDENNEF